MFGRAWCADVIRAGVLALLVAAAGCRSESEVVISLADGVVLAPSADAAAYLPSIARFGMDNVIVPWWQPGFDAAAFARDARAAGVAPVLGLAPARRAEEEWNAPDAVSAATRDALAAIARAGDDLGGVHVELGATPPSAGYLGALLAAIRAAVPGKPISVGVEARGIGVARLQAAGFPPPGDLAVSALDSDEDRDAWARAWADLLRGQLATVVVHTRGETDREAADLVRLGVLLDGSPVVIATVDPIVPRAVTATAALSRSPRLATQDGLRAEVAQLRLAVPRVLVRGLEVYPPESILGAGPNLPRAPRSAPLDPALEARAREADARLWRCCWRDGQIVSVYDGRTLPELGPNRWQEDACWITGLYTAAASFRSAVTQTDDDRARARAGFRALHGLATTTPLPGEVVRNSQRALYEQTRAVEPGADTLKRWRRSPERERYWVGDISVDQLSGWFLGMTVFHDLVATADEKAQVAVDVRAVLDAFLADDLHARAYPGERTTFGDLRAQPVLALSFFQVGLHLTGEPRYRAELDRLQSAESMHWQIGNVLALYHLAQRYGSDHFYSSGLLPLVAYEADPVRRARLEVALDVVHALKRPHGDAYADMVHGVLHPTHDAGRRAALELTDYPVRFVENARFLAEHPAVPAGPYHPLAARPAAELDFDYVPPGVQRPRGGVEGRFSGVGFLLTYWMGRYYDRL